MTDYKLKPGDLVSIEPWDCEGIEPPWGWELRESFSSIRSRQAARAHRMKLKPGTLGLVVSFDHLGVEDTGTNYVVVVGDRKLGVPYRFLHKVEA